MIRRAAAAALLAGVALLTVVAAAGPRSAPPLYDGICVASPYRYFPPKPGEPAPSSVDKDEDLSQPTAAQIVTDESPPQVQLILPAGAISGMVTLHIAPVARPAQPPPSGSIDGNVYRISATTSTGAVPAVRQPMSVVLRSPTSADNRVLAVYAGGRWTTLESFPITCAFQWLANTQQFGDFALINPAGSSSPPESAWTPGRMAALAAGALAVLVAVILLIRTVRARRPG